MKTFRSEPDHRPVKEVLIALKAKGWSHEAIGLHPTIARSWRAVQGWWSGSRKPPYSVLLSLRELDQSGEVCQDSRFIAKMENPKLLAILFARGWTVAILADRLKLSKMMVWHYKAGRHQSAASLTPRLRALLNEPPPRTPVEVTLGVMNRMAEKEVNRIGREVYIYRGGLKPLMAVTGYGRRRLPAVLEKLEKMGQITNLGKNGKERGPHEWQINARQ